MNQRKIIWSGMLEWTEKPQNPSDPQKVTKHVLCSVLEGMDEGEPRFKAIGWPSKFLMALLPKQLLVKNSGVRIYLKNSHVVPFHPTPSEALDSLSKIMSSGFVGFIHFTNASSCNIKLLILCYEVQKKAYLGFVPKDQAGFIECLKKTQEEMKPTQIMRKVENKTTQQTNDARQTIWNGLLEWSEKSKIPTDLQKVAKQVQCSVRLISNNAEPELKGDGWPCTLIMKLRSRQLLDFIGKAHLQNSKKVQFYPQPCEALDSLTKVMSSGYAGSIIFTNTLTCEMKLLILMYSEAKQAFFGFILNDKPAFVDRLRKVIQEQKSSYQMTKQNLKTLETNLADAAEMADVIDLLSSDEEENNEAGFISPSVTLEPVKKKRKLENGDNVIVLTDEEDSTTTPNKTTKKTNATNLVKRKCIKPTSINSKIALVNGTTLNSTKNTITENSTITSDTVDLDADNSDNSTKENEPKENEDDCVYTTPKVIEEFIAACEMKAPDSKMLKTLSEKVPILLSACKKAQAYTNNETFKEQMAASIENLISGRTNVAREFSEVVCEIRNNYDQGGKDERRIKKLNALMKKLAAKTKKLESAEVDFDDEDDSSYIKMQRYRQRTAMVFKKIKQIEGKNPHMDSVYYSRLDFGDSSYPEINRAISKKFSDREKIPFPTMQDVDKCIRKCAKQHDLKLSEGLLKSEIGKCFHKLGELIQRKRRQDLAYVHHTFLDNVNAPNAPELEERLKQSSRTRNEAMDKIFQKYVVMQETNENPDLSSDSDDSNLAETEDDNDDA